MKAFKLLVEEARVPPVLIALAAAASVAPGLGAATIRGHITECAGAVGADGYVVRAFEQLTTGFPGTRKPCEIVTENPHIVGTATVRADGSYSITYTPTEKDPDFCFFDAKAFVKVFLPDGQTLVNTSAKRDIRTTLTFDFDTGSDASCPQVLVPTAFELDPPSIVAGGPGTRATVVLESTGGSRTAATTVTFFASDESGLVLPREAVVPAGQSTAVIDISADPPGGRMVTIFASANGTTVTADLSIRPDGPMKGLINGDDRRDISDPVFLLNFLFTGGSPPAFPAFADVNGSGKIDISDAVAMLGLLFTGTQVPALCSRDLATLPSDLRLSQQLVTDGEEVLILGNFPEPDYRVVLRGFAFPNGRLISGNTVLGERRLVYCTCVLAVRSTRVDPDGVPFVVVPFRVPLDAPSGEYEVYLLPSGASCPGGNSAATGCLEDDCAIGPLKLFVQPSHIVSMWEELDIHNNSEPPGDNPAELFFTFVGQSGEPNSNNRFPTEFNDSYPGGRAGSHHLTSPTQADFRPDVPVFVGREADMDRAECDEECLSSPDPAVCRAACAAAAANMNGKLEVTVGGAEFDCLDGCSSIWDEVAGIGVAALGCLVGVKTGNPKAGCAAGVTLGAIVQQKLEDALEDEDDDLGAADFNFNRDASPSWQVEATFPPHRMSSADMDILIRNHRLPAFRVIDATLRLKSVTLVEADDEPCFAPDELFLETRASLGLLGVLGDSTRFPSSEGLSVAEGATQDLSGFSVNAGGGADSSFLYVEIGVWDFDGEDENELIGLHSRTLRLGEILEANSVAVSDFVVDGHERRRVRMGLGAHVTGWNSIERCDCSGIQACGTNLEVPHGIADIAYEIEVIWEKYPQ